MGAERILYDRVVWGIVAAAVLTALALVFIRAPYGRHARGGWGPELPSRWAWVIMETPPVLAFALIFASGEHRTGLWPLLFLGIWQLHYFYRAYIFPFRLRVRDKRTPWVIVALAWVFNCPNAYVNARWVSHLERYPADLYLSPTLWLGLGVFFLGLYINRKADAMLIALREEGGGGYKIPRGWLYEYVACPNYLGEFLEWVGWAIMTGAPGGWAFALYTAANLFPRARSNLQWYRETFEDYPKRRRAVIPFVF